MKTIISKLNFKIDPDNAKLIIIALLVSIVRSIQLNIYYPFVKTELIGPVNYLQKVFAPNNDLIITESTRILSNLPMFKIAYVISNIIGYSVYENIQYVLLSFIFFIGVYRLCFFFSRGVIVSLLFSITLSLTSYTAVILNFCYPFIPSVGKAMGSLAQNFLPLLLYYLISEQHNKLHLLLGALIIFHPGNGLNFAAYSIFYVISSKSIETKRKLSHISVVSILILAIVAFMLSTQPQSNILYAIWKKIAFISVSHPYTWMYKYDVASLVNVVLIVLFMQYLIKTKVIFENKSNMTYFVFISITYVLITVVIAVMADIFGMITLVSFYPSRLTVILIFILIIQLSLWFAGQGRLLGINVLPQIIMVMLGFYIYPFLLWFIFICNYNTTNFIAKKKYGILIYPLTILILSTLRYSSESFVKIYLAVSSLYPVIIWLLVVIVINTFRKINIKEFRIAKKISALCCACIIFSIVITFYLNKKQISFLKYEKEIISVIKNTPPDSVFLYLQTENEMDNIIYFIENAYLRNSLPGRASIGTILYVPSLAPRLLIDVQCIYGANLLDDEFKSENELFLLYRRVLKFSATDWLRIKKRYPLFRYVLTSTYLSGLNEKYFKKVYSNPSFCMYEIQWDSVVSDY